MKISSLTDIGTTREMNQDYLYSSEEAVGNLPNLFLVADGMGGHKAGEFASRFAVEAVVAAIRENQEKRPVAILSQSIQRANRRLKEYADEHQQMKGMGTTIVAAVIDQDTLIVANVGDSRLYIIGDTIEQITEDHSLVQEMVRLGKMDEESARNHPNKNIITRAIGVNEDVEPVIYEYRLKKGDMILMCTDGLSNMVEDEDMFNIVKGSRDVVEAVQMLIEKANSNGGRDNIGVIVAEPLADEVSVW